MRKFILGSGLISLLTGVLLLASPSAYAATPPDSCFNFGGGYISDYYDNEDNNPANPACPREVDIPSTIAGETVTSVGGFASKQLTSVTIPNSVTDISFYAFADNQLASIVIPNSVTSIGNLAFMNNNLTSVTLSNTLTYLGYQTFANNQLTSVAMPNSVTVIDSRAFAFNRLASVIIPTSVTSIAADAFTLQGVDATEYNSGNYSSLTDTYYTRIYTEDSSNPSSLQDGQTINPESFYNWDVNGDGDQLDVISEGGHVINPAQVVVSYKDANGSIISPATNIVGIGLSSYIANDNTTHNLSGYFRIGSSQALVARNIEGYMLRSPSSPHTMSLAAADGNNSLTFIYSLSSSNSEAVSAPNAGVQRFAVGGESATVVILIALAVISAITFALNKFHNLFIRR